MKTEQELRNEQAAARKQYREDMVKDLREVLKGRKDADRLIQSALDNEESAFQMSESLRNDLSRSLDNYLKVCSNMGINRSVFYPQACAILRTAAENLTRDTVEHLLEENDNFKSRLLLMS